LPFVKVLSIIHLILQNENTQEFTSRNICHVIEDLEVS